MAADRSVLVRSIRRIRGFSSGSVEFGPASLGSKPLPFSHGHARRRRFNSLDDLS